MPTSGELFWRVLKPFVNRPARALMKLKHTPKAWRGYVITYREGDRMTPEIISPQVPWWKCVLPWPGKKVWAETQITKAILAGAEFTYEAVSEWDWDEAWVVHMPGEDTVIASSSKVACALAYLKHKGLEV